MKCEHNDCFTCPYPDCIIDLREAVVDPRKFEEKQQKVREYNRLYYQKRKAKNAAAGKGKITLNWIPIEERVPEDDKYILLSFSNFSVPEVGRYEDGNFYAGDDEKPLTDVGVFVNAWMPLPKCYQEN